MQPINNIVLCHLIFAILQRNQYFEEKSCIEAVGCNMFNISESLQFKRSNTKWRCRDRTGEEGNGCRITSEIKSDVDIELIHK